MQRIFVTLVLLLFATYLPAQTQLNNPAGYFDYFNKEHSALAQANLEYMQYSVHSDDVQEIAQKRLALLEQTQSAQTRVSALDDYEQDAGLKAAMLDVLGTYKQLFEVDMMEIQNLKLDASSGYAQMERYMQAQTEAEREMAAAGERFLNAQRAFARTNGIILQEDAEGTSLADQLNKLNDYQRSVFLPSFRAEKANARFLDAMNAQDVAELKASRNELQQAAAEALNALKTIGEYNGDTAYRDAVIAEVSLLAELAQADYAAIINAIEKQGAGLTQADVDAYNRAVQRVNTSLNPATEKINTALQQLLRNNVPKPSMRGVKQI